MFLKRLNKGIFIVLLYVVLPASVFAESGQLWNKLTAIAANNWLDVNSLSTREIDQIESLAQSGDSNAQYALGMIYQVKHEHDKAQAWLKHAAEQGHVPARYSYNKHAAGHPDMANLSW